MALGKDIKLDNGLNAEAAYIRIDTINGNKEKVTIQVNSYVSKGAFEEGKSYLKSNFYEFSPSVEDGSENFIKQGYEHLKTLPEFESAVDVLE